MSWREWALSLKARGVSEDMTDEELQEAVGKIFRLLRRGVLDWRDWAEGHLGKDGSGLKPPQLREELGNLIARGVGALKTVSEAHASLKGIAKALGDDRARKLLERQSELFKRQSELFQDWAQLFGGKGRCLY
ncbi:MAG: hypothetical protein GF334_02335 [Candidatus Altiarchaeales archaeon]|nr:hypothetical protein [Candidatus Altiarchaeales archaeon]